MNDCARTLFTNLLCQLCPATGGQSLAETEWVAGGELAVYKIDCHLQLFSRRTKERRRTRRLLNSIWLITRWEWKCWRGCVYPKASSAHSPGKSTNGSIPIPLGTTREGGMGWIVGQQKRFAKILGELNTVTHWDFTCYFYSINTWCFMSSVPCPINLKKGNELPLPHEFGKVHWGGAPEILLYVEEWKLQAMFIDLYPDDATTLDIQCSKLPQCKIGVCTC